MHDARDYPPSEKRICAALRTIRSTQNLTQQELGERVGAPNSYISRWETGRIPSHEDLWSIETIGLRVPAGSALRMAGFVEPAEQELDVLTAIERDLALSPLMKSVLAATYNSAIGATK